jgi:hypothetical protein
MCLPVQQLEKLPLPNGLGGVWDSSDPGSIPSPASTFRINELHFVFARQPRGLKTAPRLRWKLDGDASGSEVSA